MPYRRLRPLAFGLARLCLVLALLAPLCAFAAPALIIVVRHAEKAAAPAADPPLTPQGRQRADEFARLVQTWASPANPVRAIFASEVLRTQQTVAPLGAIAHVPVTISPAKEIEALVKKIRAIEGGIVVVAGHSNTVPAIVEALGGEVGLQIADAEYDRVFIVTPAGVLDLRYGTRTDPAR